MITIVEKPFFSFPQLVFFTNSTYNTLIREEKELFVILLTPSDIHPKAENNNSNCLFFAFSDNNTPPLQRSLKIYHKITRYGLIAQHIPVLSIA